MGRRDRRNGMNPTAILALIADLYEQNATLRDENGKLRDSLAAANQAE